MFTTYWFARGYFDGRKHGEYDHRLDYLLEQEDADAYERGYQTGVRDYLELNGGDV